MKKIIRNLIPYFMLSNYRKLKRFIKGRENAKKSTEEVFSEIYQQNLWGGDKGELCSGGGSSDNRIVSEYVNTLKNLSESLLFSEMVAVDLGCGDMRVGDKMANLFSNYIGVDIVNKVVETHRKNYPDMEFFHIDIIEEDLPDGDVCFLRQVLQHLSNEQILKIIPKLEKFKYVFITEHLPSPNSKLRFNTNKPHGGDVRLYGNSGIYLDKPPFSIESTKLRTVLEVQGHGHQNYSEPWMTGMIRTILYTPNS